MTKLSKTYIVLIIILSLFSGYSYAQPLNNSGFDLIRVNPVEFPIVFDLRNDSILSDVRTQANGGCWSSSTMVTIEAWWRQTGLGDFYFSDINLQLSHGFDNSRNTYGNHYMATAYFSRGSGPVEKDAHMDSLVLFRPLAPYILSNARYLPQDLNLIKQTIMDFGPVYSMLYFKRKAVDSIRYILNSLDNPKDLINHAVALVGWNDTMSTMQGNGVWIAQNSLGKKFGESGFFYIPYENEEILKHNAVWTSWDSFDQQYDIHYYDTLGSFNSYGFNDSICYGLVKFTAEKECAVIRLASHINAPGTYLQFEVYSEFDENLKKLSAKIGQSEQYHCVFPGYYTLSLSEEIKIKGGSDFYILAKYIAPNDTQPLPVEETIKNYAHPFLTSGKCWVNPNCEKWPDA